MQDKKQPLELHLHTFESFCEGMLQGRPLPAGVMGEGYVLPPETRSLLGWYLKNRGRWNIPKLLVRTEDCEEIARAVGSPPPSITSASPEILPGQNRKLRITKLRCNQFGGLHRYATDLTPAIFELSLGQGVTLVEGKNGAGKTSLLSAICWCLTGYAYRSTTEPKTANDSKSFLGIDSSELPLIEGLEISTISPIPPASTPGGLDSALRQNNTWVELELKDEQGETIKVKRSLRITTKGEVVDIVDGLDSIGILPIAWRLGTQIPAQIPYISFDQPSSLGSTIGSLIGLRPLRDLALHADRVRTVKFGKELPAERRKELVSCQEDFVATLHLLREKLAKLDGFTKEAWPSSLSSDSQSRISSLIVEIKTKRSQVLGNAAMILGSTFDLENESYLAELKRKLTLAEDLLSEPKVASLPTFQLARHLSELTSAELDGAHLKLDVLVWEAAELVRLSVEPAKAARVRLYQLIAGWMKSNPEMVLKLEACPLCFKPFAGSIDPAFDEAIEDLLASYLEHDKQFLARTLDAWAQDALIRLAQGLPVPIAAALDRGVPTTPADLFQAVFERDLLSDSAFQGPLSALQKKVKDTVGLMLPLLPPFSGEAFDVRSSNVALPEVLREKFLSVVSILSLSAWLHCNQDCFEELVRLTLRGGTPQRVETPEDHVPVSSHLADLGRVFTDTEPLESVKKVAEDLLIYAKRHNELNERIVQYGLAATALEPLTLLGQVVEEQLSLLMVQLDDGTKRWRDRLYSAAVHDAPSFHRSEIEPGGRVKLISSVSGTMVSSHLISNASELRACLLAFVFAFLRYVLEKYGGLATILLDDPQDLFDFQNRSRAARALTSFLDEDIQVIVATNDETVREEARSEARSRNKLAELVCMEIHPAQSFLPVARVTPRIEQVRELRRSFDSPVNAENDEVAREYVRQVRIFCDECLNDGLGSLGGKPKDASLAGLLDGLSHFFNHNGVAQPHHVKCLLTEFPTASMNETLALLNNASHGGKPVVRYGTVKKQEKLLNRIQELANEVRFELFRWRPEITNQLVGLGALPPAPPTLEFVPKREIPIVSGIAAFTRALVDGWLEEEVFDISLLSNKSYYRLNTENFGLSAKPGQIAIVDLDDDEVGDGRLVVALYREKVFARRLLRFEPQRAVVALGSEAEDPRNRKQSQILRVSETRLLRVTGILFSREPPDTKSRQEASLLDHCNILDDVELCFRVDGVSALPLALAGQLILAGPTLSHQELKGCEGEVVAVSTKDGTYFKRIGKAVGGSDEVRVFEGIGHGHSGTTLVLRVGEGEEGPAGLDDVVAVRSILGVLYPRTT